MIDGVTDDEAELVARIRRGDTSAFHTLVRRYHASMLRVAASFVAGPTDAEDVVQETWIAVIRGIAGFEGRASLRTWIFSILVNRARSHGAREATLARRSRPVPDDGAFAVPEDRFAGPRGHGGWREPLTAWQDDPQVRLDSAEGMAVILAAIDDLPPNRRQVVVLRDVEGWTAAEVAEVLGISAANQRVLLHRGRAALRLALEAYATSVRRGGPVERAVPSGGRDGEVSS